MTYPDYVVSQINTMTERQARVTLIALTRTFSRLPGDYGQTLLEAVDRYVQEAKDRS